MDGNIDKVREALKEIQEIKWLIDEGPAHARLTEAQTRLSELANKISAVEIKEIETRCANRAVEWQKKLCALDDWPCYKCDECEQLFHAVAPDDKSSIFMFPSEPKKDGGWTIRYDFLVSIQDKCQESDDDGKPSLEKIEEVLLALGSKMRSALSAIDPEAQDDLPEVKSSGANTTSEVIDLLEISRDAKSGTTLDWVEVGIILRALKKSAHDDKGAGDVQ